MSYILEALKKSEQKRKRDTIPELLTVQSPMPQKQKRHPLWLYLILFALLLNTCLLLWWLRPWQPEKQKVISQPTDRQQLEPSAAAGHPVNIGQQTRPLQAKSDAQKRVPEKEAPTAGVNTSREVFPAAESRATDTGNASGQRVLSLNELPSFVQQNLPNITISAHFYDSRPGSGIVSINGRIIREGQTVSSGLKLEQITSDGVIFSYQGYRFYMGVF